ncbi:MAG TPA: hypothetical protein VFR59_12425 [Steroidobacteraceae bacterium]|nr:hypothetical protein [Steroidobacteraceae bacterium]
MSFGWGRTLEADVDASRRIRVGERTVSIRVTYRLQALRDSDGYRVRAADLVVRNDGRVVKSGARSAVLVQFMGLIPDWRIASGGGFVGLADYTCQRDKARQYFTETSGSSSPEARRWIEQITSREVLSLQARQHWNAIVGDWAGKEVELGDTLRQDSVEAVALPSLGDSSIRTRHEISALERLPCHERMVDEQCVKIRRVSRPDAGDLERAYARLRKTFPQMAKNAGGSGKMDVVTTLELIADPDTLRPYRLRSTTRRSATDSDELTVVYKYQSTLKDFKPLPSGCAP